MPDELPLGLWSTSTKGSIIISIICVYKLLPYFVYYEIINTINTERLKEGKVMSEMIVGSILRASPSNEKKSFCLIFFYTFFRSGFIEVIFLCKLKLQQKYRQRATVCPLCLSFLRLLNVEVNL